MGLLDFMGKAKQAKQTAVGHLDVLTLERGDGAFDTEAEILALVGAVGVRTRIWEFTVPAQQRVTWGFGSPAIPANQGYWTFVILDEGTGFDVGIVHLGLENNSGRIRIPVVDCSDTLLHGADDTTSETAQLIDKNQMQPLPECRTLVGQDSRLVIDYTTVVLQAADDAVFFAIPITVYE